MSNGEGKNREERVWEYSEHARLGETSRTLAIYDLDEDTGYYTGIGFRIEFTKDHLKLTPRTKIKSRKSGISGERINLGQIIFRSLDEPARVERNGD